ncbi:MAG: hypothetical protein DRP42_06130 [Tenericutes bacterium]|nr:MAG: hypothetical protein DRP42_06130 [Mycoplasmatota bacterium]
MDKATESELSSLHGMFARVLKEQLEATATIIGEDGEPKTMSMVTPALLAQVGKFLKDNDITATTEIGDDMDALKDILAKKQKKGRAQLATVSAIDAAKEAQK